MLRSSRNTLSLAVLFASLAAAASTASAATRVWPVLIGPGCNGTLQQCISGAAVGDTVRIIADDFLTSDAYTAVDEDIFINNSLTLEAAPGIDATFATGRGIVVSGFAGGSAPVTVTLRGLTLRDGGVFVNHAVTGVGTYTVERLRIVHSGISNRCPIEFDDFTPNDLASFRAYDNTIELRDGADVPCGIRVTGSAGGAWAVDVRRNRIRGTVNARFARGIDMPRTNTGAVEIIANQVRGFGFDSGIFVHEGPGAGDHTLAVEHNSVVGQEDARAGTLENGISITPSHADVFLNNNSVIGGTNGIRIYPGVNGTGDRTAGRAANNLVAYNTDRGLSIGPTTILNRNNLVFANGFNSFSAGPGTVTADPQLEGPRDPRLRSSSPARNAGNNADVNVTLPAFDADGEARLVGTVDIGAFEHNGDVTVAHETRFDNTAGNETRLNQLNLLDVEHLIVTPHHDAVHGAELANTLGVYTPVPFAHSVFHENLSAMSTGRRISVMAPFNGRPVFLHTSTLANTNDRFTTVNHPALNGRPSAIAFVTHNYSPDGAPVQYHDQRIGMTYSGSVWSIDNQDATVPMALGRTFNVAVAPVASPNAFTVTAATNTAALRLEHPLLDDNACAAPFANRNLGTPSASNVAFTVEYIAGTLGALGVPGHWMIRAAGAGSPVFAAGTRFNVMVHGAQANACAREDGLFSNGFE